VQGVIAESLRQKDGAEFIAAAISAQRIRSRPEIGRLFCCIKSKKIMGGNVNGKVF